MKQLPLFILILCTFSCSKKDCINLELGTETELASEDLVCIDGTEYTFFPQDMRCPCNVDCFWGGEFILNFEDAAGVNVYTFHQVDSMSNVTPPFAESFRIIDVTGQSDCGDESKIDDVTFFVQID